ncbi:MAG: hypothetical protein PHS57_01745 [Alphaproteobacteria bacterium]|nr:hypothetical protein [Alphaproteobacteria bacterium]
MAKKALVFGWNNFIGDFERKRKRPRGRFCKKIPPINKPTENALYSLLFLISLLANKPQQRG